MNIKTLLAPLQAFMEDKRISKLLGFIDGSSSLDLENIKQEHFEKLRTELINLLSREQNEANNKPLADAVYNVLLGFAQLSPINSEDYFTLESISPDKIVRVSTGHQFDIVQLIKYHTNREYRGSNLRETPTSKFLLNPAINLPFSQRDTQHILDVAKTKGMEIPHLKVNSSAKVQPDLNYGPRRGQRSMGMNLPRHQPHRRFRFQGNEAFIQQRVPQIGRLFEMPPELLASIASLDAPLRNVLNEHQRGVVCLVNAARLSLQQLIDLNSHHPDFLNEALLNAIPLTNLISGAQMSLNEFFSFEPQLRSLLCTYSQSVVQLVSDVNVPIDELPFLSIMASTNDGLLARKINLLVHPACIRALQEKVTTLEVLAKMTVDELHQANEAGNYSVPLPSTTFH